MTELMKKYITATNEENQNNELYQQFIDERNKKLLFIVTNEDLLGHELKSELMNKIFEFYENYEQFKEVQQRIERASHELSVLWEIATDQEKNEIEQYFNK